MEPPPQDVVDACAVLSQGGFGLVAIDGLGGSGKSSLARQILAAGAASAIVEMDDFYRPVPESERESFSPREGFDRSFDWERLQTEVLEPLRRGEAARYRRYDWEQALLGTTEVAVSPSGLVIVEGVYTLRPELRRFWDLAIYLQMPADVRLSRLLARGENTRAQIDRWMASEHYFEHAFSPADHADIVLNHV